MTNTTRTGATTRKNTARIARLAALVAALTGLLTASVPMWHALGDNVVAVTTVVKDLHPLIEAITTLG